MYGEYITRDFLESTNLTDNVLQSKQTYTRMYGFEPKRMCNCFFNDVLPVVFVTKTEKPEHLELRL